MPAIKREVFDWGVRLTVQPFMAGENQLLAIRSEIGNYRYNRGCDVRITFPGVSLTPLRVVDAQTWHGALGEIIKQTRAVEVEMKAAATKAAKSAKSAKPAKARKRS
ncbi:MAG: hypothetical protein ACOY3P_23965 [Planctomycetota bacterium]